MKVVRRVAVSIGSVVALLLAGGAIWKVGT
jgi:hypothetical protein